MTVPTFTFDKEINGYISDAIAIEEKVTVRIELESRAPVVTLKQEKDGGWANYGQSPRQSTRYGIDIHPKDGATVRLATPVRVVSCYVI